MLNQVVIRRAEITDLKAIYEIEKECFQEDAFPLSYIAYFLKEKEFITLVTFLRDKVIGYVTACLKDYYEGERAGHIYSIAVKPEYRRRGVGSRLLEEVEKVLRENGAKICHLETHMDNINAINFYLKHGYRIVKALKNYYGAGKDGIKLMKTL